MGTRSQCYRCSQTAQRPIQGLGAGEQPPAKCSPPAIAHVFAAPYLICWLCSGLLKAWEWEPAVCSPPAIAHELAALQAAWLSAEDPAELQPAPSSSLPRLPLDRLARTGRDGAAPDSPLDLSAIRSGHAQLPDSQRSHRATHTLLTGEQTAPGALSGKSSMVKPPASLQQPVLPGWRQAMMLYERPVAAVRAHSIRLSYGVAASACGKPLPCVLCVCSVAPAVSP